MEYEFSRGLESHDIMEKLSKVFDTSGLAIEKSPEDVITVIAQSGKLSSTDKSKLEVEMRLIGYEVKSNVSKSYPSSTI